MLTKGREFLYNIFVNKNTIYDRKDKKICIISELSDKFGGYYKNNTLIGIVYNTNKTTTKGGVVL